MARALLARYAARIRPDVLAGSGETLAAARLRIELLAGFPVALALVPEAVAFAFVAGVHPFAGPTPPSSPGW